MTIIRSALIQIVSLFLLLSYSLLATASSWQFHAVPDSLPASEFADAFAQRQFSLGTTINNRGHIIGYWLDADGVYHGFNVLKGTNPEYLIWDTPDFLYLSAGEPTCVWIFCSLVVPYGIRIADGEATSAFLTTVMGSSPLPGSLPFSRFPGNFVDTNAAGIVATTQRSDAGQFGAIISPTGVAVLDDVPWLVAINDLAQPLVLGYQGVAECAVYGCEPPVSCEQDGDAHAHQNGQGHYSHGNGNGYGHDPCRHQQDDDDGAVGKTLGSGADTGSAILIRLNDDGSTTRFAFPDVASVSWQQAAVSEIFPLALNNTTAIVRADVVYQGMHYHQQLLRCDFDAEFLDLDADGILDCGDGLVPLLDPDDTLRMATVLGFNLNHAGVLIGNLGFSDSGIGEPFSVDIAQTTPTLDLLVNQLQQSASDWELNVVTDINASGNAIGFGYQQCGAAPDAYYLTVTPTENTDLGFAPTPTIFDTRLAPGSSRTYLPAVRGGSGAYMYRYFLFDDALQDWVDVQGWSDESVTLSAPLDQSQLCLRVQVADTANPDDLRERVIRFAIGEDVDSNPAQPADTDLGVSSAETLPVVGSVSAWWAMCAGMLLGRRRKFTASVNA